MAPRTKRKKSTGRKRKRTGRGRGLVTILLFLLAGFFGVSIYLGWRSAPPPAGGSGGKEAAQPAALELPEPAIPEPGSPTLVVLNGCGRPGLAATAARWFRRQGFDVFDTGNADNPDYERTLVILRSRREEAARKVADRLARTLGIGVFEERRTPSPEADVLLILGKDFPDSLPVF